MVVAQDRPPDPPGFNCDLGLAELVCYESMEIAIFKCGCWWVAWSDRAPITTFCEGHVQGRP